MGKPGTSGISRLINATVYSWQGLRFAFRNESAFRLELAALIVLIPGAFWLGRSGFEIGVLLASCLLVVAVELLNSAIEAVVDRVGEERHELAGGAKDMGSAAVLISLLVVGAVWVGVAWDRFYA